MGIRMPGGDSSEFKIPAMMISRSFLVNNSLKEGEQQLTAFTRRHRLIRASLKAQH
jgi:hypothetical protein